MAGREAWIIFCFVFASGGLAIFVDNGIPYNDGPVKVGELEATVTIDSSPKHVKVYFPLDVGDYAVVYFLGGLSTLVPAEFYSIFLTKLASHGFFVFGVDYDFPFMGRSREKQNVGQDINTYFKELEFLINFMDNRTVSVPRWDHVGVMCHSAGCDISVRMLEMEQFPFLSTAFLEPFSQVVRHPLNYTAIPALMYGTQLAEEGFPSCNVKGFGFEQFYQQWTCPRIALEAADFGHCDIMDPIGWEACHITHFCKTTNDTRLDVYRQFVQGVTASFFISTLQGREGAIDYITDASKLILKCLVAKSDINC